MSTATATLLPPADPHTLDALDHLPDGAESVAFLTSPSGETIKLPPQVYKALTLVVRAMAEGQAVTIAPQSTTISTQEAANMLGISRPTLVKLLREGAIPYTTPGRTHHRLRVEDVLAYRDKRASDRSAALDAMVALTEDLGLYEH